MSGAIYRENTYHESIPRCDLQS